MSQHYGSDHFGSQHFGANHFAAGEGGSTTYADMAMVGAAASTGVMALEARAPAEYGGHFARDVFKRRRSKRERDDEIVDDLKRALGLLRPAPAAIVAPVVEVIAPHVEQEIETVPAIKAIDWRPFIEEARKRQELRDAIARAKARQDEEDEEVFMLMAA